LATRILACAAALLAAPSLLRADPAGPLEQAVQETVGAADPAFRFDGRIDASDPAAPVLVWQSSEVRVDFEGPSLEILLGPAVRQVYLEARVDGEARVLRAPEGRPSSLRWPGPLGRGRHQLALLKRSEASAGTVAFRGIRVAAGSRVSAPAQAGPSLRMLFLGDSITAGACNEDGPADQWDDRRSHNALRSYAALTASALGAAYENISVSGMGISEGYTPWTAGEVWDRAYPDRAAARADLAGWIPGIVLINFGENDASYTRDRGRPFPPDFVARYLALVSAVRAAYPSAEIVLLRGGMSGGATDPRLIDAWGSLVSRAESSDPGIRHYVFTHWTKLHPRVADDEAMAGELARWLRAQPFLGPR
jgi:lysophospholipase L1-like esterase